MNAESSYPDFDAIKQQERAAYLLAGYFQYELNAEEEEELDRWINARDANLKLFEELTDEKRMAEYLRWYTSRDVESRLQEAKKKIQPQKAPLIRRWWKYAAAAAILITVGLVAFFWRSSPQPGPGSAYADAGKPYLKLEDGTVISLRATDTVLNDYARLSNGVLSYTKAATTAMQELVAPRRTTSRVILPDQTKVWLNAASSIRFPGSFDKAIREVIVTGECYFEIAGNAAPFVVIVNGVKVQATGTAFNIKAYPGDPYMSITLTEGTVKVSSGQQTREVRKDEQLRIPDSGKWMLEKANRENAIAWTENKLQLNDANIQELKQNLERWYDITVIIRDDVNRHLNGTFSRDISLTTLLELLEQTNDVHFKVDGNRVTVLK